MNILHVVDQISQQTAGGSAKVPFQLAEAQAKLGHDVTIYTSDFNAKTQESPNGVKMVKYNCLLNLIDKIRITPGLATADFNFDIIHLHNYRTFQNLVSGFNNFNPLSPPYVIQAHGNSLPIKTKFLLPIHNFVWRKLILKRASRFIADSTNEIENYLNEKASLYKITVLSIGIDLTEFENLPDRKSSKQKQILFMGRLDINKGIQLLIQAMKYTHDVKLMVAGMDYGYESTAKKIVELLNLEDRIEFIGPLFGSARLQAYVNADIFIMPSKYETWGLTWMEALACGTPVILTDTCVAAKVIENPLGRVVPYDSIQLASQINSMLSDGYGNKCREHRRWWIRRYSWDLLAPKYIGLYKEVLRERILNRG